MPEPISLDDSSYDELYERAMGKLRVQAPWWTHREVSDPGIMLIEMWALLWDMQSYYLDQVQESHYRKYLKLLGIRPDQGECAWAWVFFQPEADAEKECVVPEGTKLLSGGMVFETEEEVRLMKNSLYGFYQGSGENQADAMKLFRKNRFVLEGQSGQEGGLFTFVLDRPLNPKEDFRFLVLLDETAKRNPPEEGDCMVKLVWEYFITDSWKEVQAIRDDTKGLLRSGIVVLRTDPCEEAGRYRINRIRCRIGHGAYDVAPVLYKICLNVAKAVQKDTLCRTEEAEFTGNSHRVALKSYLGKTGRLWILRKSEEKPEESGEPEGKGILWEDITDRVSIDGPVKAGRMERYVSYEGTGHVMIVCAKPQISPEELACRVTGVAAQQIPLPWKSVMRSSVGLMIKQAGIREGMYRTYEGSEPEEDRCRYAWHWEEEENVIVLGDGRHGEIPPPSEEGLRFTSLVLWEGEKGNVPVGGITKWEQPELFPHITCMNYLPGREGRSRLAPSRQFDGIRGTLMRQERMVTEEDIRDLAMETPGLIIRRVTARWKGNGAEVIVFPRFPLEDGYCVEWYRSRVEKYLEPYRLAGMKIKVEVRNGSGDQ